MLILTISTSTKLAQMSIFNDDNLLGSINISVKKTHSTYILDQINSLLLWTNCKLDDIETVIVGIGPGSFTGVRITSSIIKGLFIHRNIKIYVVNELDVLAYQASILKKTNIIALIDGNKEKIYYAKYLGSKRMGEYKVGKLNDILNDNNYTLIGDAVLNYKKKILENGFEIEFIDEMLKPMQSIFFEMYKNNLLKEVDIFNLVPEYLEKTQAEKEKYGLI